VRGGRLAGVSAGLQEEAVRVLRNIRGKNMSSECGAGMDSWTLF